jgi:hypothetical protein
MATGYEQIRSVVAALAGDRAAADSVELELPETGVCSTDPTNEDDAGAACCGSGDPQPIALGVPVGAGAGQGQPGPRLGFATGRENGYSGDAERGEL